jgi:glycosidase
MPSSVTSPEVRALLNRTHLPDRAPFPSPQDWRDVWIYFIMLDRFNNPAAPPRTLPWDGSHGGFQGGTLNGVREQLDYLKDLGVGAIWLSPALKNLPFDANSYHGYGIHDFLQIDPRFTSDPERARLSPAFADDELHALVDASHERGLYVILDVVLNHTGDVFSYVDGQGNTSSEALWRDDGPYPIRWRDETGQPRPDWPELPDNAPRDAAVWPRELQHNELFRRQGNGFSRSGDLSEAAGDFFSLKEFNTPLVKHNPLYGLHYPVRHILTDVYAYLMIKFDIDGYRLDTL